MFNGNGVLELTGDHLDLSYRNPNAWPNMTPGGSIKSFSFDFGDPEVGPIVQLGLITAVASEPLDWAYSIDPPHFHGSDQFRVISGGEWNLTGKPLPAGGYAFQESGLRYQEHPGENGEAWVMLVVGDRRGVRPTLLLQADYNTVLNTDSDNYKPLQQGEDYPHPAGPRGVAAIVTTNGRCERGYLRGTFDDLTSGDQRISTLTGVFGDENAGPSVHLLRCEPNQLVAPESECATERFLVVTKGSCRIGDSTYMAGDMRIQKAETTMPEVISGDDGLHATFVIADRRAQPIAEATDTTPIWWREATQLQRSLNA